MRPSGFKDTQASSSSPVASTTLDELQVGQVLDGRFKIVDVINRGGMAWVYKALDGQTGRLVAVKVPFMRFESDPGFFSRFQREEYIGLTLDHPYIGRRWPPVFTRCVRCLRARRWES
jgi:serine/threonine protein kinase